MLPVSRPRGSPFQLPLPRLYRNIADVRPQAPAAQPERTVPLGSVRPSLLLAAMEPPWFSTIRFTMPRLSPTPYA